MTQLFTYVLYNIQEDLQVSVKDGCQHLTGLVSLGEFYKDITKIENGKISFNGQGNIHLSCTLALC